MNCRHFKEKLEAFKNIELSEGIYAVRFDLSDGNIPLSAKLAESASDGQWNEVKQLLEQGADPRICRVSDNVFTYSPLFYALQAQEYEIAMALYDAGDRLDDLRMDPQDKPVLTDFVLRFLAEEMDRERNYFIDESKNVSECMRCGLYGQANRLIDEQGSLAEDLDCAVFMAVHEVYFNRHKIAECCDTLKRLLSLGADVSETREDLIKCLTHFKSFPVIMRPNEEYVDKMIALLNQ